MRLYLFVLLNVLLHQWSHFSFVCKTFNYLVRINTKLVVFIYFDDQRWCVIVIKKRLERNNSIEKKKKKIPIHLLKRRNVSALKVRLGDWDITKNVEPQPHVEVPIASIVIHPEYSASTMHNDIAVITLSGVVAPTDYISPVCLPPPATVLVAQQQWTGCQVSGWGTESFERPRYPGVLKKVSVPLWDRDRCVKSLRTTRLGNRFELHDGFLCAGGEEREDACKVNGTLKFVSCQEKSYTNQSPYTCRGYFKYDVQHLLWRPEILPITDLAISVEQL